MRTPYTTLPAVFLQKWDAPKECPHLCQNHEDQVAILNTGNDI
ncbi:hypothetical protein COO91_10061 (plasmid) [Nostoc flagelliforme CCNUN1]|uniref:Uncharacterized protein n=1 Tax=Nostoc flagelliforme CCNUN1 TaxID=2038116 RepID=A0A2K8T844_9NOSO|nr:hypothetical protein COO91_10061 [Nostoc flagelliforme CCNUN1]